MSDTSVKRSDVSRDIDAVLKLPSSLVKEIDPTRASQTPTAASIPPATELLDGFSVASATPEDSQRLIGAYIRDMRKDVLSVDRTEEEKLTSRIDLVRERGEEIKGALSDVKI